MASLVPLRHSTAARGNPHTHKFPVDNSLICAQSRPVGTSFWQRWSLSTCLGLGSLTRHHRNQVGATTMPGSPPGGLIPWGSAHMGFLTPRLCLLQSVQGVLLFYTAVVDFRRTRAETAMCLQTSHRVVLGTGVTFATSTSKQVISTARTEGADKGRLHYSV